METINIRYGQTFDMTVGSDDPAATEATLYVGNAGQIPVIVKTVALTLGSGQLSLTPEETSVPLGEYRYQINIVHSDGKIEKYPAPEDCDEDGLPRFIVYEALDVTEVV